MFFSTYLRHFALDIFSETLGILIKPLPADGDVAMAEYWEWWGPEASSGGDVNPVEQRASEPDHQPGQSWRLQGTCLTSIGGAVDRISWTSSFVCVSSETVHSGYCTIPPRTSSGFAGWHQCWGGEKSSGLCCSNQSSGYGSLILKD